MGTAVEIAASPRSSIMFLMSMERSATCRSIAEWRVSPVRGRGQQEVSLTNIDGDAVIGLKGDNLRLLSGHGEMV
jgi:hypothetical protein